jgi:hypothetical protein
VSLVMVEISSFMSQSQRVPDPRWKEASLEALGTTAFRTPCRGRRHGAGRWAVSIWMQPVGFPTEKTDSNSGKRV